MKKDFDYKKFIQYVHEKFSDFSEEDIECLFELNESYEKDDPKSQGKILSLNEIIFSGTKPGLEPFSYQRKFQKGINVWIADNFKGKSTIFKIIKFCLTGNNTIKGAIKDWFNDILLEFSLAETVYTVHIDATAYHINCALYRFGISDYQRLKNEDKLELNNPNEIFKVKGEKSFAEKMEEFFFKELSYYNLQFRLRPGNKNESVRGNVSWATYFKSIYLESSNYEYLYFNEENIGKQGTKILEMLLGLKLTYPINQLTVLRDLKLEKIRNTKFILEENKKANKGDLSKLTKELDNIEGKLSKLNQQKDFQSFEGLLKEYGDLETSISRKKIERNTIQSAYNLVDKQLSDLESEIRQYTNDIKARENEIKKIDKDILQKELFVETESFFTNLDVQECPHCEHIIGTEKKEQEKDSHICSLCGTSVTIKKSDDEQQKEHLAKLNAEKEEISKNIKSLKKQLDNKQSRLSGIKIKYDKALVDLQNSPKTDDAEQRLSRLSSILRQQTEEQKQYQEALSKKENYIQQKGALQYRIEEIRKQESNALPDESAKFEKEVEVLNYGISGLIQKRNLLNDDMLKTFQNLILAQIQEFGITSITDVKIDEKYDLVLVQHGKEEKFENLVEGEKLRVKLAFYLSIIQLDIDHQLGRHPRFLIFDAPGSEEMISSHLSGLIENFKLINTKFQDNLQIFIGSAVRDFSQITDPSKSEIKEDGEFLF
ncbi:hypothetical protein FACS189411_12110 [Bacteroidia bacterium]|nr:hypothetical protein FACS189411_12110 [Bacteroidia bacterium]